MLNDSMPCRIMNRWHVVQFELIPELEERRGALTPKLERLTHSLDWVRIEEFRKDSWCGTGRPDRGEERQLAAQTSPLARRRTQMLAQMIQEIPTACDWGAKCNA